MIGAKARAGPATGLGGETHRAIAISMDRAGNGRSEIMVTGGRTIIAARGEVGSGRADIGLSGVPSKASAASRDGEAEIGRWENMEWGQWVSVWPAQRSCG